MSKIKISGKAPHRRRRAIELFSVETNFRPKIVETKKKYKRHGRYRTSINQED
jgi:hypothetical protein